MLRLIVLTLLLATPALAQETDQPTNQPTDQPIAAAPAEATEAEADTPASSPDSWPPENWPPAGWPPAFVTVIEETQSYCEGSFSLANDSVQQRDLNGDGRDDWILDSRGFTCTSNPAIACGLLGCGVQTLINGQLGLLTLHPWDLVTDEGETFLTAPNQMGQTIRHRWTGIEWEALD